jgi:hypothetical protein
MPFWFHLSASKNTLGFGSADKCDSRSGRIYLDQQSIIGETSRVRVERDIDAQFRARQLAPKTEQQFRMAVLHLAKSSRMECITRIR